MSFCKFMLSSHEYLLKSDYVLGTALRYMLGMRVKEAAYRKIILNVPTMDKRRNLEA